MRMIVQRVNYAKLYVDDQLISKINSGYLVYLGVNTTDNEKIVQKMVDKLTKLRLFTDADGKMNLKLNAEEQGILVVSNFVLYGDVSKNNRPSFTKAAPAHLAEPLYQLFLQTLKTKGFNVQSGVFGAHMHIETSNDGPINLIVEIE